MGAVLDPDVYDSAPSAGPLARGDYTSIPARFSLRQYTPTPGDQGSQGSCVGWAVAYAARTLAHASKHNLSPRIAIDAERFSPSYVYNQIFIRSPDEPRAESCMEGGAFISDALDLLMNDGVALLSAYPYDASTCFQPISRSLRAQAGEFRIASYARLFNSSTRAKHIPVRRSLAAGRPVVFGMRTPQSFHRASGTWSPTPADLDQVAAGEAGGHAMTIIGYDDNRSGGAFEVINSWGTGWGNDGFIWISYETFNRLAHGAFEIVPPSPAIVDLGARLEFVHIGGDTMAADAWGTHPGAFRLSESWPSGARFRVELTNLENSHVHVVGGDLTGRYVPIFPRDGIAGHAGANDTLLLPGPTEEYFTRLDDTVGTDFYVALVSKEPLDVTDLAARMARARGDVFARLQQVLGNDLITPDDIERLAPTESGSGIAVQAVSGDQVVLPIIVAIDHVAPDPVAADEQPPEIVLRTPAPDVFDSIANGADHRRVRSRSLRLEGIAQDESEIAHIDVSHADGLRFSSRGPFEAHITLPDGPGPHRLTINASDVHGNTSSRTFMFEIIN